MTIEQLEQEIIKTLKYYFQYDIVNEQDINEIIAGKDNGIAKAADRMFMLVLHGKVKAVEVDVFFPNHPFQLSKKIEQSLPDAFIKLAEILKKISGEFRTISQRYIQIHINRVKAVNNIPEFWRVQDEAIKCGILIRQDSKLSHNYNLLGAKSYFKACQRKSDELKKRP